MEYKCINVSFFVQNALLKGRYSCTNVALDLIRFRKCHFLALLLNSLEIIANYAEIIVLKYDTND